MKSSVSVEHSSTSRGHGESTSSSRGNVASRLGPPTRRKTGSGVSSSVGAVIKHDVYVSDEEYDPLNPSVGAVASVVKVSERK